MAVGYAAVSFTNQFALCSKGPVGNCDIDFSNFRHWQVQNFLILNQSERDQNFAINFWNHQKQKQKL